MKQKFYTTLVKQGKPLTRSSAKKNLAVAIETKLAEIKTNHTRAELYHSHLAIFR
jgi:hypothetical protein